MIRRPPRSTQSRSSAASDVYKRQEVEHGIVIMVIRCETGVAIMSAQLETVMIVQNCSREVKQVHVQVQVLFVENNGVSSGYVDQQIRAKVEIVGVVSHI